MTYGTLGLSIVAAVAVVFTIAWKIDAWLQRKRKSVRGVDEKVRELDFAKQLEQRLGTRARVVFEEWTWPRVSAFSRAFQNAHFLPMPPFTDYMYYFKDRGVGYYSVELDVQGMPLKLLFVPYGKMKIKRLYCFGHCQMPHTPIRMKLGHDIFLVEHGAQLESRSFNKRYTLWSDDQRITTAVFDPQLIAHLEKFPYWHIRSLYIGHERMLAEAEVHFAVEEVIDIISACEGLIRNYQSATKGVHVKPKGEL